MAYRDELASVASAHADELVADLEAALHAAVRADETAAAARREVAWIERLLALIGDLPSDGGAGQTLHEAMEQVLDDSPAGMLRAGDLAAEINRRGLYRMRDGRPVEAQQIHARVGNYADRFEKHGTFIRRKRGRVDA